MKNNPETKEVRRIITELQKIQQIGLNSDLIIISKNEAAPQTINKDIQQETDVVEELLRLLRSDWFMSVVGYFKNHRPSSSYSKIVSEYQVQDLIYCLALSIVPDLQYEDPQQKNIGALTSTRIDFYSREQNLFLEIKFANSTHTAKRVEEEIAEDIYKYGMQTTFSTLIFFIYCADGYAFPNPREFERGKTDQHTIAGHQFYTYCIVKP